MAIYLVQHGKSLSKDQDPEQGLSETGVSESRKIAQVVADYGVCVSSIEHSVKKRARMTAEIFAEYLKPAGGIIETQGLKAMEDVTPTAKRLFAAAQTMIVGHLPFLDRLSAYLISGAVAPGVFRFQNSGVVCMDQDENHAWRIAWTISPHIR